MRRVSPIILLVALALLAAILPPASAAPADHCPPGHAKRGLCTPAHTPTPEPTPVPSPTPTMPPHEHDDHPCGVSATEWHPPVVNGCATGHEHGAEPPAFVLQSGYTVRFDHHAGTPRENELKHTSFKGFTLTHNGVDIYLVTHLDTHPNGHTARFHSYQLWARDPSGAVSHWHGWLDFGVGDAGGPQVQRFHCDDTDNVRPIMAVNSPDCPGPLRFENWYSRAGGSGAWSWDFGFNVLPQYYALPRGATNFDMTDYLTWQPTGYLNDVRRFEAAWYADRSSLRGTFYATQWGEVVSGPQDVRCGAPRTIGGRIYTTLCLEQYIAPSMPSVTFPGNAVQRTFDVTSVQLPN